MYFIPVQNYSAIAAPAAQPKFQGQSYRVSRSKKNKIKGRKEKIQT